MDVGMLGGVVHASTGFVVLLAGLLALGAVSPRRHTVSFSLFLVLWGGSLLAGSFAGLSLGTGNMAQAEELFIIHAVLQGIAYLPLLVFTLSYPPSRQLEIDTWPRVALLLAPAVALLGVVWLDPSVFHEGFVSSETGWAGEWGLGKAGVFAIFWMAILAALARLVHIWELSSNPLEKRQALHVILGLTLYLGYESMEGLSTFDQAGLGDAFELFPFLFSAVSLAGLGVVAWLAHHLLRGSSSLTGNDRHLATACLGGSILFGLASGASLVSSSVPDVPAGGAWRLGAVALLISAVTRFDGVDPDNPVSTLTGWLGWFGVGAATLVTLHLLVSVVLGSTTAAFLVLQATVLAGAGYLAWRRPGTLAEALRRLRRSRSSVGVARRNLEHYEVALLSQRPDDALTRLRSRMSITDAEHAVMQRLAACEEDEDPLPRERRRGPGDVLQGRYLLDKELGQGAQSRVFRALDLERSREVAIKFLDPLHVGGPQAVREFLYESRTFLRLRHPNIVEAYEFGHDDGWPYLVFELLEGGTLRERIDEDGLAPRQAIRLVDGILAGLEQLHRDGLVHRDLKPDNILIDRDGNAKIGDVGLAGTWDADRTQRLSPDGSSLRAGTPAYMSPEALLGEPARPTCDVYAVGAILVEALSGSHYLGLEETSYRTVKQAVIGSPPRLHDVDPDLVPSCRRALAKNPGQRYASASQMREDLRKALDPDPGRRRKALVSRIETPGGEEAAPPPSATSDLPERGDLRRWTS
jgi:hypothetical protein